MSLWESYGNSSIEPCTEFIHFFMRFFADIDGKLAYEHRVAISNGKEILVVCSTVSHC